MATKWERCPKCGEIRPMTEHHIVPRRVVENNDTYKLCRECHNTLEVIIHEEEKRFLYIHRHMYLTILEKFVGKEVQDVPQRLRRA